MQIPAGEQTGLHLVGYWQTHPLSGPPTDITAVYAFENWSKWDRPADPKFSAMSQEYLGKAQYLRPKYESKFLMPVRFSPLNGRQRSARPETRSPSQRPNLYLHSTYHVEPGKMEEYLDIVERLQLPPGEKYGLNLVGYWQTHPLSGPSTDITAIYRCANWAYFDGSGGRDPEMTAKSQEYGKRAQFLRPKYETKFLIPVRFSPLR